MAFTLIQQKSTFINCPKYLKLQLLINILRKNKLKTLFVLKAFAQVLSLLVLDVYSFSWHLCFKLATEFL